MTHWIIGAGSRIDLGETAFAAAPSTTIQRAPAPCIGGRAVHHLRGGAAMRGVDSAICGATPPARTGR